MTEQANPSSTYITCPECQAGIMNADQITYFTWLSGELITVPDFPAWICDMCGRREYDRQAVSWLNILLSSNAKRSGRTANRRPSSPDQPPAQP